MNILLCSYAFAPSIGGIESSTFCFASGLTERGHDVTVITATSANVADKFSFRVVRSPGFLRYASLWRRADVVWHNNISLRFAWPLIVFPKPFVVTHQTWLGPKGGGGRFLSFLKRLVCTRGSNVFISRALRDGSRLRGQVVPNPYDDKVFKFFTDITRDRDVAFVGRLIPGKGAVVLIDAVAKLATRGIFPKVTIIGDGCELNGLKTQAARNGVAEQIVFAGAMHGSKLALQLNRHRVLAVPSEWDEPFGIVALEGAACGCFVIGTQGGGLPEAIGPCGSVVPNSDATLLADALDMFLSDPTPSLPNTLSVDKHLAQFKTAPIIQSYENILQCLVGNEWKTSA